MRARLVLVLSAASIFAAGLLGGSCGPTGGDLPSDETGGRAGGDESGGASGNGGDPGAGGSSAQGSGGVTGSGGSKGVGGSSAKGAGGNGGSAGNGGASGSGGHVSGSGGRTTLVFPPGPDAGTKADAAFFLRDAATQRDASTTKHDTASTGVARDATMTFFRRD